MTPEQIVVAKELALLRRTIRVAERLCRRRVWRRAVQHRATKIAVVLAYVERALGDRYSRRQKTDDRRWAIFGRDTHDSEVLVAMVGGGSTRRLEEVRMPIPVEILQPRLIDLAELRRATRAPETKMESK